MYAHIACLEYTDPTCIHCKLYIVYVTGAHCTSPTPHLHWKHGNAGGPWETDFFLRIKIGIRLVIQWAGVSMVRSNGHSGQPAICLFYRSPSLSLSLALNQTDLWIKWDQRVNALSWSSHPARIFAWGEIIAAEHQLSLYFNVLTFLRKSPINQN